MALTSLSVVVGLFVFFIGFPDNYNWMAPLIENWKLAAAGVLFITMSLFGYVAESDKSAPHSPATGFPPHG